MDISGKGIAKLVLAVVVLLAIVGVAMWIYNKAKGAVKPVTTKVESAF